MNKLKQKKDRYEMHKYWGKKPSADLSGLIEAYSKPGDTVLDPFSGYGVFTCEAYLLNRSVVANDLNPIARFINEQLLEDDVDLELLKLQWKSIRKEFLPYVANWYKHLSLEVQAVSVLRDKNDMPLAVRIKVDGKRGTEEIDLSKKEAQDYIKFEEKQKINDWYPDDLLIQNSRISAKKGMNIADLFTKRTLACHSRLLTLINKHSRGNEKKLLLVAFTSNLANCSKLVPPISSRGRMSQGAWMTGFYTGPTYIENNVLHYFENRLGKIIKGKQDFLAELNSNRQHKNLATIKKVSKEVLSQDAKNLTLENDSIDYVFTDPPYGGAVPYFEQSIIWNSWLGFKPDYDDEIVISDSKEREKHNSHYQIEINKAFAEISRVLKKDHYFSLTYHSLSGLEWKAITNACIKNGFELVDYRWLVQKSFTPRQINRAKSIKGDVLVTLKNSYNKKTQMYDDSVIVDRFVELIESWIEDKPLETNDVFLRIMKKVFSERLVIENVNLLALLNDHFIFNKEGLWVTKNEQR